MNTYKYRITNQNKVVAQGEVEAPRFSDAMHYARIMALLHCHKAAPIYVERLKAPNQ